MPLLEVLFTLVVFGAILALFTEYAEAVVAGLLLAVIWQFVDLFGASLLLATVLISIVAAIRAVAMVVGSEVGTPALARFLDELLTADDEPGRDRREHRGPRRDRERVDTDVDTIDDYRR